MNDCCYQVELYDYCEKKGHSRYNGYCYNVSSIAFKNEADCNSKGGVAYNNLCYSVERLPEDYLKDFDCEGIDGIWYKSQCYTVKTSYCGFEVSPCIQNGGTLTIKGECVYECTEGFDCPPVN